MNESEKQFSITRVASNKRRRQKANSYQFKGLFIVLGLAILVPLSGCHSKSELGYVPLVVGATWEYRTEAIEEGRGKEKQIRAGTTMCRCVARESIAGKDYLKCMTFMQGSPGMSEFALWERQAVDGIYEIRLKPENPEILLLPLPLRVGLSWTNEESQAKSIGLVEAVETVDLPERSYPNCLKIKYDMYDGQGRVLNKTTLWLAKGVGWVKVDTESVVGHARTKLWLTRYSIGGTKP
jgi:hypothetical protein